MSAREFCDPDMQRAWDEHLAAEAAADAAEGDEPGVEWLFVVCLGVPLLYVLFATLVVVLHEVGVW